MELILTRIAKRRAYTIGRLSILKEENEEYRTYKREEFFCDTLEPPVLEMKTSVSKGRCSAIAHKGRGFEAFCHPRRSLPGGDHLESEV